MLYKPTRENFPLMEALAVAVAVDRTQGFVKSAQTFYDQDSKTVVRDNRTLVLNTLRVGAGGKALTSDGKTQLPVFVPTDEDRETAEEIFRHFDQILVMETMTDSLVKVFKDGRTNEYNKNLAVIFGSRIVDANRDLAMITSLPNSRRVSRKREEMVDFYTSHRNTGYIGQDRQRTKVSGKVVDVKSIAVNNPGYGPSWRTGRSAPVASRLNLVTFVTGDNKIGTFFLNDKDSDLAKGLVGQDINFLGTVKKQEVNKYTSAQETMFNRVKFE